MEYNWFISVIFSMVMSEGLRGAKCNFNGEVTLFVGTYRLGKQCGSCLKLSLRVISVG